MTRLGTALGNPWSVQELPSRWGLFQSERFTTVATRRVLLDGEHIADLDWLGDDQPFHLYRLTPHTADRSKLEYALHGTLFRPADTRVAFQHSQTGGLMPDGFFLSNVQWDELIVRTREFGFFQPPIREAYPEDEIPGFGTWVETQRLLQQVLEEDQRSIGQWSLAQAAKAVRNLPRPAMPAAPESGNLPIPADPERNC